MTICIFGDSITWGSYDPERGGWANQLRNYWEEKSDGEIVVYNLGVSGDTTTDLLARVEHEAAAREPDMIVFAIGTNDAQYRQREKGQRTSPAAFAANLEKLTAIARKFTEATVFIGLTPVDESRTTPIPWNTNAFYFNKRIDQLDAALTKFCAEKKIKCIPIQGAIGTNDLADGLHPNSQGHEKMFKKIRSGLEPMIAKSYAPPKLRPC